MKKCGDVGECVSTLEAVQLSELMNEFNIQNLPVPGDVDFITGGPPCQVEHLQCKTFRCPWKSWGG